MLMLLPFSLARSTMVWHSATASTVSSTTPMISGWPVPATNSWVALVRVAAMYMGGCGFCTGGGTKLALCTW